jgi:hypothetical protein
MNRTRKTKPAAAAKAQWHHELAVVVSTTSFFTGVIFLGFCSKVYIYMYNLYIKSLSVLVSLSLSLCLQNLYHFVPPTTSTTTTRVVSHCGGFAIYIKTYLKAKEEL